MMTASPTRLRRLTLLPLMILLGLLAACSGQETTATATAVLPQPQAATPRAATESALPAAGRTAEGTYYLGDPSAPVTLTDYSDFL